MGNACSEYTFPPVLWYRRHVENRRQRALDALIDAHRKSEKFFDGRIGRLRNERRKYHAERDALVKGVPEGETPSADVIDEVKYLTLEMHRINRNISSNRGKLSGVRGQLRHLDNVHYNKELQKNWVKIKENFKKLGLAIEDLTRDAEAATEAMQDVREFNDEHADLEEQVFSATSETETEEQQVEEETARLFKLTPQLPVQLRKESKRQAIVRQTARATKQYKELRAEGEGLGLLPVSVVQS